MDTPEGRPKALQTSECNELLGLTRAVCLIAAQRQPGKFTVRTCWQRDTGVGRLAPRQARASAELNGQKIAIRKAPQTRQRLVKGETLVREMRRTQRQASETGAAQTNQLDDDGVAMHIHGVTQPDVLR